MLVIIAYVFISAIGIFSIIFHFFGNRELHNKISYLPGPKSYPLIGCAYLFVGNAEHILTQLCKIISNYSSPFRIEVGPWMTVGIHDPEQVKNLLMSLKAIEKPNEIYKFVDHWVGNGLATSKGLTWRTHRKLLQPAFNQQIHKASFDCFLKYSTLLTKSLEIKVNGKEFDIFPFIATSAVQILCESTFGVNVESKTKIIEEYIKASERTFEILVKRIFSPWLHLDILFNLSRRSKIFVESIKEMKSFTADVIKQRRKELQSAAVENENTRGKKPFLDLMLELADEDKKITEKEVQDHANTILFAGQDTTSWTTCFIIFMLASHPEIQDKVYEELYKLYGAEDPEEIPMKYEDLQHMEYLERVIKETMRLLPIAPVLTRKMVEDFDIGGHTIPKDCTVFIPLIKLHRDQKLWIDPLKFDPDRFLPEEVQKRHPFAFIPFLAGPRSCLGRAHAMMTMKIQVGTIIRKFILIKDKITPVKDIRLKLEILLRTVDPITIRLEKRVQSK